MRRLWAICPSGADWLTAQVSSQVFGQEIELRQILHESGVPLLRVILRDGGRYQTLELDPATAHAWGKAMSQWAEQVAAEAGGT